MKVETPKLYFKIMILGDSAVGKTCLLHRYTEDKYDNTFLLTLGCDFKAHSLEVEPGVPVTLQFWDVCGLQRSRELVLSYSRGADGHLLVFDLRNRSSFEHIRDEWYPMLPEGSQCVLVGHKSDMEKRDVSREEAETLAQELGTPYMEVSAATGHNVKDVFETLARQIYKEKQREEQRGEGSGASWCCHM